MNTRRQPHHRQDSDRGASFLQQVLGWSAFFALAGSAWRVVADAHAGRHGSSPRAQPQRLQTWESEGGRPIDGDDAPTVDAPGGADGQGRPAATGIT